MPDALDLAEAVRRHVQDGSRVYIGNFGAQLFCVGHELIRQGRRGLHAVIASGGLLLDQLLGAGVLSSATFGHCWSPVGPTPAYNFRRFAESGDTSVALHELSLGLFSAALMAGAYDLPFMPVSDLAGAGYIDEDWTGGRTSWVDCAFGGARVISAEVPDVAFIHVDIADADGNGVIRGPLGEVVLAAQAARSVVLVAEQTVPGEEVRRAGVTIPGLLVDTVVELPGAVLPDGAIGRYDRDVAAYERYSAKSRTPDGFAGWLRDEVLPVSAVSERSASGLSTPASRTGSAALSEGNA
jgi:glutaconate CoA-transferase subunit A